MMKWIHLVLVIFWTRAAQGRPSHDVSSYIRALIIDHQRSSIDTQDVLILKCTLQNEKQIELEQTFEDVYKAIPDSNPVVSMSAPFKKINSMHLRVASFVILITDVSIKVSNPSGKS
jgi:hypothetical protein